MIGIGDAPAAPSSRLAWRMVVGFGVVSLAADMVYEGARSAVGPLLSSLGASAALVGLISGIGEAVALMVRLASGTWADRTGQYWGLTYAGYAMTAVCVPLLAITPFIGVVGLGLGCVLMIAERFGKAIRSPAKTVLLARAADTVGLGRGFGVHKALDQLGAVLGPLLVAAVIAITGTLWTGFAVLAIPGAVALLVLVGLKRRSPAVGAGSAAGSASPTTAQVGDARLPRSFWVFAGCAAAATAGLVTFPVIAYHLVRDQVTTTAVVPVLYAVAMAASGVAALATGWLFDRVHARVLLILPVLVVAVPLLAFSATLSVVIIGVVAWGAAVGLQDSTVKALVADLAPSARHGTAYGVFAAVQGGAAILGGVAAGTLYGHSDQALTIFVAATQLITLVLLVMTMRQARR